jgi:hypothetical protein
MDDNDVTEAERGFIALVTALSNGDQAAHLVLARDLHQTLRLICHSTTPLK